MGGLGVSVLGRAAPRLAAASHASPAPFVLMLDDLHDLLAGAGQPGPRATQRGEMYRKPRDELFAHQDEGRCFLPGNQ